ARERAAWAALGAVQKWRVAGPYAALRFLQLGAALPLDGPTDAAAPRGGPAGPTGERDLDFPDGDVGLEMEPGDGDVFYAASEVTAARGGDYLAWLEGAAGLELRIDGAALVGRNPYPRESRSARCAAIPTTRWQPICWRGPPWATIAPPRAARWSGCSRSPARARPRWRCTRRPCCAIRRYPIGWAARARWAGCSARRRSRPTWCARAARP